jgi:hypothetical protein
LPDHFLLVRSRYKKPKPLPGTRKMTVDKDTLVVANEDEYLSFIAKGIDISADNLKDLRCLWMSESNKSLLFKKPLQQLYITGNVKRSSNREKPNKIKIPLYPYKSRNANKWNKDHRPQQARSLHKHDRKKQAKQYSHKDACSQQGHHRHSAVRVA